MSAGTQNLVWLVLMIIAASCGTSEPTEDHSGPCWQLCMGKHCGVLGDCVCGSCKSGDRCTDENVCVSLMATQECLDQCEEHGWVCGFAYDGCNCGQCPVGWSCKGTGSCFADPKPCQPQCGSKECGDDGCGGSCGDCIEGNLCLEGVCTEQGDMTGCEVACAAAGKECGDEGECQCGQCQDGWDCNEAGICSCHPECAGKECGDDGCGDSCGACPGDYLCNSDGLCMSPDACEDPCKGKECGPDGCNGDCGICVYGTCKNNKCSCTPNCDWKECGSDGCGQSCGNCPDGSMCGWDGKCHGFCDPINIIGNDIQKVNKLDIGKGGQPGQALNIDSDMETCSPDGDCTNGLDNQLSALVDNLAESFDLTVELNDALTKGDIVMLFELVSPDFSGKPFPMAIYFGKPVAQIEQCNFQASFCEYLVEIESFDLAQCKPYILFDNAVIEGDILRAGGPQHVMKGEFLVGAVNIPVELHKLHLTGNVTFGDGGKLQISDGILAGAIPKQLLVDAIDQADEADLPMTKEAIKYLLNIAVINDVDIDDNGSLDAASIGVVFQSIPGSIVGIDNE